MNALQLILRGVIAGLAISAPVGPVNVLCISRTISKGKNAGLVSGLGAATADTIYGAIAGFSISFVIRFLVEQEFRIRLGGGILLIVIGIIYYQKTPRSLKKQSEGSAHSDYVTAFLLNLTNPTTVLSFLAVLAILRLEGLNAGWLTLLLIGGIFFGAMVWWILLASVADHFRDRVDDRAVTRMNRIGGVAIGAFGVLMILLSRSSP